MSVNNIYELWSINKRMKHIVLIIFCLFIVIGCNSEDEIESHVPSKEAVELNKQAMKIAMFEEGYNEKVDSAIVLLQEAIKIDSLYQEAIRNLVRFAFQKNDIDLAIESCHDLQRISSTSPMYLEMEGAILEAKGQIKMAKKIYKQALSLYENELNDALDEDPNLEFSYIMCLVINNEKEKARARLKKLQTRDHKNPMFDDITIEEIVKEINSGKTKMTITAPTNQAAN